MMKVALIQVQTSTKRFSDEFDGFNTLSSNIIIYVLVNEFTNA